MSERPVTPKPESLDEIVSHSAVVLADQIQKAAAWAKSEMDLQIEVAGALKEFARRAKITLEVHHNITVATGRPDSVYSNVIVEYKDPGTLSGSRDAANNKKLIEQIRQRFYDMRREENRPMNSLFGVGTDGEYFVFVRFRDEKWMAEEPLEVNRYSTERFLWALYNLGQKGKPYQPEYLHGDFGSDSLIAQEGVRTLYDEILKTENPKAQVFFTQWKILFGEVCGYDVENLSDKLKRLAEFYGVKGKPHPGQLLFALHTYYALLIKLLAAEIVSFFNPWMTRQVEKLQNATTSTKLRRELDELERGGIFHTMGITNFLEGDLFAWYLPVWGEPIEKLVRQMVRKLDDYNPGTFSEDPAQSRDLLKKLYQQLFPKSVRHDLGEYYTPDWLADHVLNELSYEGDPDKRLLDPACGSGTFLVMAINRIRRWYDEHREKCAYDEGELLKKILANVIGFDLNPLAVMAARTNYLVAVKDLIRHSDHVEIPIYLCDSIMTPSEYGDLFTGTGKVAEVPCSAMKPPFLLVPKEIAKSPEEIAKYADILEHSVKNAYPPEEFLSRCHDEGLSITASDSHLDLYRVLVKLDKANKNGIWARIIKNNFAPLFVGTVHYVCGKVTGEKAEELIASLNGQLEAEIDPGEIYKRALVEGTLNKQSKEEIKQAVERAEEAYRIATTSLFRDTSSYSFDSYQRNLASPVGLNDLEEFTHKFITRERRQIQRKDGFEEFLTPEVLTSDGLPERYRNVTFDRGAAIRNPHAEFFALGHPFVDTMLRYVGNYEFGGHTAVRVIKTEKLEAMASGYQFNFTVRRRVAREDGDEHLFDFYTVVVGRDGVVDDELAGIAASSYSDDVASDPSAAKALERLDIVAVDTAFEVAKVHLEGQTKLWDWDEEVDVIGVAKVVFLPK